MRLTFPTLLLATLFLISCGSSTQIKDTWTEEGVQPSNFEKVAILSITNEQGQRRIVENEVVTALNDQGINATASYSIFPEGYFKNKPAKQDVQMKLENAGVDGLLTIALLSVKEETHYNPGSSYYGPYPNHPYYRGYYSYYSHWHPTVYDPGYYSQSTNIFLESNLYDVNTGEMIWTAQSKTVEPSNLAKFADSYSSAIARQLVKDGVLQK